MTSRPPEGRRPNGTGTGQAERTADDELVALEREGWNALSGLGGADYYRDHLDENVLMAFPFGVLDRQQALEAMASAAPWSRYH